MRQRFLYGVCLIAYFISDALFAAKSPAGIGKVANNLMEPVGFFSDFIYTGCFVLGACFLFASVIKYIEHRRSPLMVSISTVVFLFFAGILFLALPFTYLLTQGGTPYTLLKRT